VPLSPLLFLLPLSVVSMLSFLPLALALISLRAVARRVGVKCRRSVISWSPSPRCCIVPCTPQAGAHDGGSGYCSWQVEVWVYSLGWLCRCEIKPVNNENRSNFNEENKKGTERKNTCGPNDAYLRVIWACTSSSYPVPSYPRVLFVHSAWYAPK
jgi:hypothetical protein